MTASCTNKRLRILDIVDGTIVDGPGLRTSIYCAGCGHECPGCHNQQSWDFNGGYEISIDRLLERISDNDMDVTLSGGDPLYQVDALLLLCRAIHEQRRTIWCYTGFTYEAICKSPSLAPVLGEIDVLVDGPYIESQRDLSLRFRGSVNQRLIDARRSTPDHIVMWEDEF